MANRINVDLFSADHIEQLKAMAKTTMETCEILGEEEQARADRIKASEVTTPYDLDAIENAKEGVAYYQRNRVAYHNLIGALELLASVQ